MKISYKLDYALKTLLDLALQYRQDLVTITDLSERMDIPRKFLEQILLDLKKGGFVDSKRGNVGGYFLAKDPDSIKIGDIVRYIDGPIEPIACVDHAYKGCQDMPTCIYRTIWKQVDKAISDIIDHVTLATVVNDYKKMNNALDYSI